MEDDLGMRMVLPVGRSGWAIAAGYLGLFSPLVIFAPFALVLGIVAVFDIRKHKDTATPRYGMGRAIFGIVMGGVFSLLTIVMILAAIMN